MKPKILIPPAVALVIAGGWLGGQRHLISTLEKESAALLTQIAARSAEVGTGSSLANPTAPAKGAKENDPLNWKKLASSIKAMMQNENGLGDMRTMLRLQQKLQKMSKEEIIAALDEIAALDVPADERAFLENMLLGPLIQKDPELALTRFIDRAEGNHGVLGWQLSNALREWAKKDPAKAMAWLDTQIAAGKFESKSLDGKSQSRIQFEGAMINMLLDSDVDAATRRLAGMPADQRGEVLGNYSFQALKLEDQVAFAKLVRDQLPEKDQARTLAQQASRIVSADGFSEVTQFLDRIEATPAERIACAEQAAETKIGTLSPQKKITSENLDAMREWLGSQAPGSIDSITGKVLGEVAQGGRAMDFAEAAQLALQYAQASGSDDVLAEFLESLAAYQNQDQARLLAAKISDPKLREKILMNFK